MGSKKKAKSKQEKREIVTGTASIALPAGVRTNATVDAGYATDDIGEIGWWMPPTTRKNFKKLGEDAASTVSNMLYAVAFVAKSALSGVDSDNDDEILMKVMHAITSAAYASNDILCTAHYAGIQFEQKYPEYQEAPPTKSKAKARSKSKSK
jgi:hypothetical protein